jgi:hypothetical protein
VCNPVELEKHLNLEGWNGYKLKKRVFSEENINEVTEPAINLTLTENKNYLCRLENK